MDELYFGQGGWICGEFRSLEELKAGGLLEGGIEPLREEGYRGACLFRESHSQMCSRLPAPEAGTDLIGYYSIFPEGVTNELYRDTSVRAPMEQFMSYSCMNYIREKGGKAIDYVGLSQQGCGGIFSCMRWAADRMFSDREKKKALCISDDWLPQNCYCDRPRQNMLFSGTASWLYVSRSPMEYQMVDLKSKSLLDENFLSLVGKMAGLIGVTCERNQVKPDEVENVLFPNFWRNCWEKVAKKAGLAGCRFRESTIGELAHGFSADFITNLEQYRKNGYYTPGRFQIALGYGYGSHIHCLLFQYRERKE